MGRAAHFARVMEHVKRQPCIVTGRVGVDAAHVAPLVRRGPADLPAALRTLDRAGPSHNGWLGLVAVPVHPDLHRPTSSDPAALHRLGYEEWLERHGLTDAEVAWAVARSLAQYIASLPPP